MIWVLVVVVVGLITVLAELLLSYQKRAHELRLRQDPLRRSIRAHTQAMHEAVSGIQQAAGGQADELTGDLQGLAGRAEELRGELDRLQRLVPDEEDDEDEEIGDGSQAEPEDDSPAGRVRQAERWLRQEVDGHRLSLQRDVEVVRRTLTLLEAKLRRAPSRADNGA